MLEVLREDYIRTARAKGLWTKLILTRHALKNAMLPVLTVIALEFAFLLGGLVVTEQVFNLNGLGLLFVQAIAHRDYTLTQALVLLVADGVHRRELPGRPRVRVDRPADPVPLRTWRSTRRSRSSPTSRPPSRRPGWRAGVGQFVRRRPLGAIGAAVHPPAGGGRRLRAAPRHAQPAGQRLRRDALPAERAALARHRRPRSRRLLAPDLRLAHGAPGGLRRLGPRRHAGRGPGRRERLLRRVAGPRAPALHGRVPLAPTDHPRAGGGRDPRDRRRSTSCWPSPSR